MFQVKDLFYKSDLIPVIVQDIHTKQVLMLGFANEEAVQKTFETRTAWFWSRSRQALWNKGETSGNVQKVKEFAKAGASLPYRSGVLLLPGSDGLSGLRLYPGLRQRGDNYE